MRAIRGSVAVAGDCGMLELRRLRSCFVAVDRRLVAVAAQAAQHRAPRQLRARAGTGRRRPPQPPHRSRDGEAGGHADRGSHASSRAEDAGAQGARVAAQGARADAQGADARRRRRRAGVDRARERDGQLVPPDQARSTRSTARRCSSRTDETGETLYKTKASTCSPARSRRAITTCTVVATYRGHGYGVFEYLSKYTFTARGQRDVHGRRRQDLQGRVPRLREGRRGDADGEAPRGRVQGHEVAPEKPAERRRQRRRPGAHAAAPAGHPRRRHRESDHAPADICVALALALAAAGCRRVARPPTSTSKLAGYEQRGARSSAQICRARTSIARSRTAPARRRAGRVRARRLRRRRARAVRSRRASRARDRKRDVLPRPSRCSRRATRRGAHVLPADRRRQHRGSKYYQPSLERLVEIAIAQNDDTDVDGDARRARSLEQPRGLGPVRARQVRVLAGQATTRRSPSSTTCRRARDYELQALYYVGDGARREEGSREGDRGRSPI